MTISDAYVRIECDTCGWWQRLTLQGLTIDESVHRHGWAIVKMVDASDWHKCPNCVEREKKDA